MFSPPNGTNTNTAVPWSGGNSAILADMNICYCFQPEPPVVRGDGAEPDRGPALIRECPGQRFQARRLLQDLQSSLADTDDVLLEPYLQSWDQLLKYEHTEASAACLERR